MVQSKAKRRKITQSLNLQCLKCDHDCVGFLLPNGVVESYQLSRHLNSRPSCMAFYTDHVPQRQNLNKRTLPFDFSTSVKSDLTQHIETKIMSKTTSFTSSDFALSGTQNGPCDFQNFDFPSHVGPQCHEPPASKPTDPLSRKYTCCLSPKHRFCSTSFFTYCTIK